MNGLNQDHTTRMRIGNFDSVLIRYSDETSAFANDADFVEIIQNKIKRIETALPKILVDLSQELTAAAYSQDANEFYRSNEIEKLKNELIVREIELLSDDEITLSLIAPLQYPDYTISCQLNGNLDIEECTLD
ncbi:hypothetical protein GCM10027051_29560 [Niabella terrae]